MLWLAQLPQHTHTHKHCRQTSHHNLHLRYGSCERWGNPQWGSGLLRKKENKKNTKCVCLRSYKESMHQIKRVFAVVRHDGFKGKPPCIHYCWTPSPGWVEIHIRRRINIAHTTYAQVKNVNENKSYSECVCVHCSHCPVKTMYLQLEGFFTCTF